MGVLMQWAFLVLVSWAQLFVGELKGLGLGILPRKAQDMNLHWTEGTAEPLLGEVLLAGWQPAVMELATLLLQLQSPC